MAPTCPWLPGTSEEPGGAGLDAHWAPLVMRVAHEAALALHRSWVEEAGALHGGAEWALAWPGRPREMTASQLLPLAAIPPAPAELSSRRRLCRSQWYRQRGGACWNHPWIPQHPPSPVAPAGTRGCHGQAERARGDLRSPSVTKDEDELS